MPLFAELNTGVMLMRNTDWSRQFIGDVARLGRMHVNHWQLMDEVLFLFHTVLLCCTTLHEPLCCMSHPEDRLCCCIEVLNVSNYNPCTCKA